MTKEELDGLIGKEVKLCLQRRVRRTPVYMTGTVTDFAIGYYPGLAHENVTLYFDEYAVSLEGWEIVDPGVGGNGADSESNA